MDLEKNIKDCITKELENGIIEKVISAKLEECISSAVKDMFSWSGDLRKIIEEKIKSVMIPHVEAYDYSEYIVKLDSVLTEVLKSSTLENKKLLENFKELMIVEENKEIKSSKLFDIWTEFVAKEVDTDDLDVSYDDGVSYEPVEVSLEVIYEDSESWSSFEYAKLILQCEHDEDMNFEIRLSRWKKGNSKLWDIDYKRTCEISSLRHINEFEITLIKFVQNHVKIELDTDFEEDTVIPEKEPEVSYS